MKMHHHVNRTALAVLGLAVTMSSSAYAQFSTVSSRAAMNANDSVTWNSLGTDATNADLPINKTSTRGVLVTLSQTGSAWATVAISPGEFASWGFANGDVRLAFFNNSPVTLTFNPPVTAVGLNAGSVLSGVPFDFGIPIRAYRDGNLLGELSKSATINPDDTGAAPFFGVRDEGGISRGSANKVTGLAPIVSDVAVGAFWRDDAAPQLTFPNGKSGSVTSCFAKTGAPAADRDQTRRTAGERMPPQERDA